MEIESGETEETRGERQRWWQRRLPGRRDLTDDRRPEYSQMPEGVGVGVVGQGALPKQCSAKKP
jgi:hypothetical protein